MATPNTYLTTPTKTPSTTSAISSSVSKKHHQHSNSKSHWSSDRETKSRFEAYKRLQAAAVAFGEKLPIPEIVAIGGQSDGKSSLLEALLGFRFNVREVEMGTRRPLIHQMVNEPSALEPRCRFQAEDSEEYGSPVVFPSAIADIIKSRTEALLQKTKGAVSPKPIVVRAEYAHCPNINIIDTPGFVLKAKWGEPEKTPDEIISMVKSLASPPHRILLFLQQSSVEWCSSLWLDAVRDIDPTLKRTIVVVSKFDNRLKEFSNRVEGDQYLSASGYLGENVRPFFVALPKDRSIASNDEFRKQISKIDSEVVHHLRDGVNGGFDEDKFGRFIGFCSLREFLETELQRRYKEAAPATLALLERRCSEVTYELTKMDSKIQATSDVAQLRRSAMLHTASISSHVGALIDGAADPAPEQWGKTSDEERNESGIGSWPGVTAFIKPPNATLRLYGGAAFERVMHEFRCAAYSTECPPVSREKVANILLAHAGRGGSRGAAEAAAEIARTAARSWLAPLLDTACDRLAFVLEILFDIAVQRNHLRQSDCGGMKTEDDMEGYVGFHASLPHSYNRFFNDLSKQCKQLVRHHLDTVTSPYSLACYENNTSVVTMPSRGVFCPELSDQTPPNSRQQSRDETMDQQENIPPSSVGNTTTTTITIANAQQTPPGKSSSETRDALKDNNNNSHITVPETPSPEMPSDAVYGGVVKKELGHLVDAGGPRKRHQRMVAGNGRNVELLKLQNGGGGLFYDSGMKSGSAYMEICASAGHHFAKIREALVERSVISTFNSGFLISCRERLMVALGVDLFAVSDEKFMDMFVAPEAVDLLQNEKRSLQDRQKILQSCLNEFKSVARTL